MGSLRKAGVEGEVGAVDGSRRKVGVDGLMAFGVGGDDWLES